MCIPLFTTSGETLQVLAAGKPNSGSGPDFHFSKLRIADHLWSGHVEIHLHASDWYLHKHHLDKAYNAVILHVVWKADAEARREDGTFIPTLALSDYVSEQEVFKIAAALGQSADNRLLCSTHLNKIPEHLKHSWMEDLFEERLNGRSNEFLHWAEDTSDHWDEVFYRALLRGFGLNRNGEAFASLATALPFQVLLKVRTDLLALESLFFGLSGLLERIRFPDEYSQALIREYAFLKTKFKLSSDACQTPVFFALRPANFPTVRLSQIAVLLHRSPNLFDRITRVESLADLRVLMKTNTSSYWKTHYSFGRGCVFTLRETSARFTDLLILNTVAPLLWAYRRKTGKTGCPPVWKWIGAIRAENNRVTRLFNKEGIPVRNAVGSQALLELHNNYCCKNKCLQCRWGRYLLYGKY